MSNFIIALAAPFMLACPGAGSSIAIEDASEGSVTLAFCNPQQCQEVIERLSAGETAVVKEMDEYFSPEEVQVITYITPIGGDRYSAVVHFLEEDEEERFSGKISLSAQGERGGCGSNLEFISYIHPETGR